MILNLCPGLGGQTGPVYLDGARDQVGPGRTSSVCGIRVETLRVKRRLLGLALGHWNLSEEGPVLRL